MAYGDSAGTPVSVAGTQTRLADRLPAGARLWSVARCREPGAATNSTAMSGASSGGSQTKSSGSTFLPLLWPSDAVDPRVVTQTPKFGADDQPLKENNKG